MTGSKGFLIVPYFEVDQPECYCITRGFLLPLFPSGVRSGSTPCDVNIGALGFKVDSILGNVIGG